MFKKKTYFITCLLTATLSSNAATSLIETVQNGKTKKAIFIGLDGAQFSEVQRVNTPNIDRLNIKSSYTGGKNGTATQQDTNSGPGWTSLLSGTWANQHSVTTNSAANRISTTTPSVFKSLKTLNNSIRTSAYIQWSPIASYLSDESPASIDTNTTFDGSDVSNIVTNINSDTSDFIFLHMDEIDIVGHANGFSTAYDNAIKADDTNIGLILDAIDDREANHNEDWLVLISTDHGRSGSGSGHGGQSLAEKQTFIAMNKTGNSYFTSSLNSSATTIAQLEGTLNATDISPTIQAHFQVPEPSSTALLGFAGIAFILRRRK